MQIRVLSKPSPARGVLVAGCFEAESFDGSAYPPKIAAALERAAGRSGFDGKGGKVRTEAVAGKGGLTVELHGLGSRTDYDRHRLLPWLSRVVRAAEQGGQAALTVALPDHAATRGAASALAVLRELGLGDYRFDRSSEPKPPRLAKVSLLPPPGDAASYRKARKPASLIAEAVASARDLANSPPNEATPEWIAAWARKLARSRGMKARVLGPAQMERAGMGGLLAVGGGSANPPRLVRLEWGKGPRTISLVGKGVTFDTGGISIKPAANMDEMKFDKSGACAVLGIAQGAADLGLPFRFRAYLALAENMPSSKAYRPGDIVRCLNKKTVEILNTDAEGRMILADALAWAAREKPDVMIDYATLTGACVVALGFHGAGLFTADDELSEALSAAGESAGERLWRLPLWPEFLEEMRGRQADLRNSGGRWGGANTAAAFLSAFVDGAKTWAHVDIAGTSWVGAGQKGDFGATGFGVAATLTWLLREAGRI